MWNINVIHYDFYYVFYVFILYGFIGWVYESCLVSVTNKKLVNRGFLNGPFIPIYGFGAFLVFLIFESYKHNIGFIFIGGLLLATTLEYITSFIMEKLFHTRWWDYSQYKLNLHGRVCLAVSLFWGFLTVLMLRIIQPGIEFIITRIPRFIGEIAGYFIIGFLTLDLVITIIYTVKFEQLLGKVYKLRQDMLEYIATTKIFETGEELKDRLSSVRIPGMLSIVKNTLEKKLHRAKSKNMNQKETKIILAELDTKMKEFMQRYQGLHTLKIHKRLITAFPTMKVKKGEVALNDLRERIKRKGVLVLSKDIKDEVTGRIKSYLSGFLRATIVGLLVLAQFALILYLSFFLRGYSVYLYSSIQILSIIIIIALINDNRNASYKISWICIIAAFPITGHIMFVLWGNRRGKKIERKILKKMLHGLEYLQFNPEVVKEFERKYPTKSRMTRYLETNRFPLFKNNNITYYPMGEDVFEAIFSDIEKAEKFILINFFIVGEGALWDRFHKLLVKKIKEGVRVQFLYDDFGAMLRTPTHFKRNLESEGFEIRVFNPIHKYTDKLYMNYRSHQKIIVVDGNVGFTGGINLADEYVNLVQRFGVWKDNGVRVEGDAVWGLTVTFLQMWEVSSSSGQVDYNYYRPTKKFEENDIYCQIISDGPANNPRNPVENIYKQMIYYAKKALYITTPYLIIEDDMREALITAANSGIDVRIITPYIPDKKNVKILTNYNYGRLLEAGVRIFEYTPGFIHAKTIITEDTGIVGTINMDYRSFHLHYECGVWICNKEVVNSVKEDFLKTLEQCHEYSYEEWKKRPLYIKIYQMILNLFSTLM